MSPPEKPRPFTPADYGTFALIGVVIGVTVCTSLLMYPWAPYLHGTTKQPK